MKHYIFYSFSADIYRKNPTIRIFINNILISEHELTHTGICTDAYNPQKNDIFFKKNIYHAIEFEYKEDNMSIKICCQNKDNNFMNGFMTKNTLIRLNCFFVISKKMFHLLDTLSEKYSFSRVNVKSIHGIKRYYTKKNTLISNLAISPDIIFDEEEKSIKQAPYLYTIGGNCTYTINAIKKHGCWHLHNRKPIGKLNIGSIEYIKFLKNKYLQNENI